MRELDLNNLINVLMESLSDAVIIYDRDFTILRINKAAEKILEVKAPEIIGKTFSIDKARDFQSPLLAQVMFASLAPVVVRESKPGEYPQVIQLSLDNPRRDFRVVTNRVLDQQGNVVAFVKLVHDRTYELELARAKSDFITMAAHQLRTPAIGLKWALDNLDDETLEIAKKTAANLLKIINDLISLSQLEEGKFNYQFRSVNLIDFLRQLLANAELVAKEYQVKLYFQPPRTKDLVIKADPDKLGVAIAALIDNAIKYNVKNGEVVVAVKKIGNQAQVIIKDTGIGMSKNDLAKLFTKFYRGSNVKKKGVSGSGLGLYLAENIVEKHKGSIRAESVLGRGSTFYLTLPLTS